MSWLVIVVIVLLFLGLIGVGVGILYTQKILDIPYSGFLLIDKQDPNEPAMVYFQALVDPKEYKNGETIKLHVKIVKPESQGKQV